MPFKIQALGCEDRVVREMPTKFNDKERAIAIAEWLHQLVHDGCRRDAPYGVRVVDSAGMVLWERNLAGESAPPTRWATHPCHVHDDGES